MCSAASADSELAVVKDGDEVIGGAILLRFRDTVEVPWISCLRSRFEQCPNNILYWEMMRRACDEGLRIFDFGRSSPDTGPAVFKMRWGARSEQLYWHYILPGRGGAARGDWFLQPEISTCFGPLEACAARGDGLSGAQTDRSLTGIMNTRYLLSNILQYSGVNAVALARRRESLTVLCYHRVLDMGDPARATRASRALYLYARLRTADGSIAERFHRDILEQRSRMAGWARGLYPHVAPCWSRSMTGGPTLTPTRFR